MSTTTPTKPSVFISYSHKDEAWKDRFIPQLRALEQAGHIVVWDDRKIDGGDKWYPEIIKAMEEASVAVCLISSDYLASGFCVKEEVPFLLQRCERYGMIFIPLLLRPCAWQAFDWLKEIQMLPRDGKSVLVDFRGIEDAVFADVANRILQIVDDPPKYELPARHALLWSPPEKVDVDRLPKTGAELFGRQKELEMLDAAWASDSTNIFSLVAWGGVGKSTLVNKWLERMHVDNYRSARRVYAWSFYSQGTGERATSADQFINHALTWFGDRNATAGSPWDKGERLARLVQSEKTLLLLDGLEPLQSPHAHERGKIKDPALLTLILELARNNPGLCVITTREQVIDLIEFEASVLHKDLEQISDGAGRALLRVNDVQGMDAELEHAIRAFGNHALAIKLLAVYLRDLPGNHISHADEIPDIDTREAAAGKHVRRLLVAFARRFGKGGSPSRRPTLLSAVMAFFSKRIADSPEVNLLRLIGLFDRPADRFSLAALRAAPPIRALTDQLETLSDADWLSLIEKLRALSLIASASHHAPHQLDAHPLVREHFGQELKQRHPAAWREGNNRLYEHLKATTKMFPETVEEMALLYMAVAHGCEAEKHQETLDEVYWPRISRMSQKGDEFFSTRHLGAFAADLTALIGFFDKPWVRPVRHLKTPDKASVLAKAGFDLLTLGRPIEAVQPIQAQLKVRISQRDWENASKAAYNLTETYLTLGNLREALTCAERGIELAIRSCSDFELMDNQTIRANALHQAGRFSEAEVVFKEAEAMQRKIEPEMPHLYSKSGYEYCDLLISLGKPQDVLVRVAQLQKLVRRVKGVSLSDLAEIDFYLGIAHLLVARRKPKKHLDQAADRLNQAVNGLRHSGKLYSVPRSLVALAELHRVRREFDRARTDLDEATRIATRGSMGLHQADCHLEYARLYLAMSEKENEASIKKEHRKRVEEHWGTAKEMIQRMGYHRRDKDLHEIEVQMDW